MIKNVRLLEFCEFVWLFIQFISADICLCRGGMAVDVCTYTICVNLQLHPSSLLCFLHGECIEKTASLQACQRMYSVVCVCLCVCDYLSPPALAFAERRSKSFSRSWSDPTPVKTDSPHEPKDSELTDRKHMHIHTHTHTHTQTLTHTVPYSCSSLTKMKQFITDGGKALPLK